MATRGKKEFTAEDLRGMAEQAKTKRDYVQAGRLYIEAAKKTRGDEKKQCYTKAVEVFQRAAETQHNAEAMKNLGMCYANGFGVEHKDEMEAGKWYLKAGSILEAREQFELAKKGNPEAQFYCGWCYEIQSNPDVAIGLYKAVASSHAEAYVRIGIMYDFGIKRCDTVVGKIARAKEWYRKAEELGNTEAMVRLGVLFFNNPTKKCGKKEAVEEWKKAAGEGNADAKYMLGRCHYTGVGDGVKKILQNEDDAVTLWCETAEEGCANAMFILGKYYFLNGKKTDGLHWFKRFTEAFNNTDPMYTLGKCFFNDDMGIGEKITVFGKAADWGAREYDDLELYEKQLKERECKDSPTVTETTRVHFNWVFRYKSFLNEEDYGPTAPGRVVTISPETSMKHVIALLRSILQYKLNARRQNGYYESKTSYAKLQKVVETEEEKRPPSNPKEDEDKTILEIDPCYTVLRLDEKTSDHDVSEDEDEARGAYLFALDYDGNSDSQPGNSVILKQGEKRARLWPEFDDIIKDPVLFNLLLCLEVARRLVIDVNEKNERVIDEFLWLPVLGAIVIGLDLMKNHVIDEKTFFVDKCCFRGSNEERKARIRVLLCLFFGFHDSHRLKSLCNSFLEEPIRTKLL